MTIDFDANRIQIERLDFRDGSHCWRAWLPHSCSPDEPDDPDISQERWGTFYFLTFDGAVEFVRWVLQEVMADA